MILIINNKEGGNERMDPGTCCNLLGHNNLYASVSWHGSHAELIMVCR